MYTLKDLKARCPGCYAVAGEVIANIDGQNVVLADLGNNSFNLSPAGQELMAGATVEPVKPVEQVKRARKPKVDVAAELDDLLA